CRDALPRAFCVAVALTPVSWHSPLHRGSPRREELPLNQPITLAAAAILNVIIGLSGLAVGLTLVAALPAMAAASDVAFGDGIVLVIPLYGLAATLGGIGTWRRSWVGWTLAAAVDGLGLGVLIWAMTLIGPHPVLLFGAVVWTLALVLLAAPQTRRVLG